jgi:TolB-like protein
VLPFQNMSADSSQEYFADGITEDLITDLSKHPGLFVIARNSTFTYKGKAVDVTRVGRELGVKFVLEGSVRKAGNQVRINAQLIDAQSGGHLWAERYDGATTDIFVLQDQVTKKIVTALAANLAAKQQAIAAGKERTSPEAYEAFLKGMEHFHRQRPEDFRQAIALFTKAAEIDPAYSRAQAALAATYWEIYKRWWSANFGMRSPHEPRVQAEKFLAVAMRTPTALAYQVAAGVSVSQKRYEDALDAAARGIALDANDPDGYVARADVLSLVGRPADALQDVERAMQLNPYYPPSYLYELGLARFGLRQFAQAAEALERAAALNPEDHWTERLLLAAYGHLSRTNRAAALLKSATDNTKWQNPLTVRGTSFWYPFRRAEDAEALAQGLVKAGVPD